MQYKILFISQYAQLSVFFIYLCYYSTFLHSAEHYLLLIKEEIDSIRNNTAMLHCFYPQ